MGRSDKITGYEKDFIDCVNQLEVVDLAFSGSFLTKSNRQEGERFVSKKLDRVMGNMLWLEQYRQNSC